MKDLVADGWAEFRQYQEMRIEQEMSVLALAMGMCDSELERVFLIAYMNYCRPNLYAWTQPPPDTRLHGRFFLIDDLDSIEGYFCRVEAQRELSLEGKTYRVDFLFVLNRHSDEGNGEPAIIARIAVELDGHDYHERTKEQAARDRSRDRAFARDGIQVLRFTGSEVYRDPDKAITEARKFVQSFALETQNA